MNARPGAGKLPPAPPSPAVSDDIFRTQLRRLLSDRQPHISIAPFLMPLDGADFGVRTRGWELLRLLREQAEFAEAVKVAVYRLLHSTDQVNRLADQVLDEKARQHLPSTRLLATWICESVRPIEPGQSIDDRLELAQVQARSKIEFGR